MSWRVALVRAAIVMPILALMGCTSPRNEPIGYVKRDYFWNANDYGYGDKQIGEDEFSIAVTGTPATSPKRVAEIALLRAADLTLEKGRTHFEVMKRKLVVVRSNVMTQVPISLAPLIMLPVGSTPTKEPVAILLIRLLTKGASPASETFDAKEIAERLGKQLKSK